MVRQYTHASNIQRQNLIKLIHQENYSIAKAANTIQIPYDNAKAINRTYIKEKRVAKIGYQQRYQTRIINEKEKKKIPQKYLISKPKIAGEYKHQQNGLCQDSLLDQSMAQSEQPLDLVESDNHQKFIFKNENRGFDRFSQNPLNKINSDLRDQQQLNSKSNLQMQVDDKKQNLSEIGHFNTAEQKLENGFKTMQEASRRALASLTAVTGHNYTPKFGRNTAVKVDIDTQVMKDKEAKFCQPQVQTLCDNKQQAFCMTVPNSLCQCPPNIYSDIRHEQLFQNSNQMTSQNSGFFRFTNRLRISNQNCPYQIQKSGHNSLHQKGVSNLEMNAHVFNENPLQVNMCQTIRTPVFNPKQPIQESEDDHIQEQDSCFSVYQDQKNPKLTMIGSVLSPSQLLYNPDDASPKQAKQHSGNQEQASNQDTQTQTHSNSKIMSSNDSLKKNIQAPTLTRVKKDSTNSDCASNVSYASKLLMSQHQLYEMNSKFQGYQKLSSPLVNHLTRTPVSRENPIIQQRLNILKKALVDRPEQNKEQTTKNIKDEVLKIQHNSNLISLIANTQKNEQMIKIQSKIFNEFIKNQNRLIELVNNTQSDMKQHN